MDCMFVVIALHHTKKLLRVVRKRCGVPERTGHMKEHGWVLVSKSLTFPPAPPRAGNDFPNEKKTLGNRIVKNIYNRTRDIQRSSRSAPAPKLSSKLYNQIKSNTYVYKYVYLYIFLYVNIIIYFFFNFLGSLVVLSATATLEVLGSIPRSSRAGDHVPTYRLTAGVHWYTSA